VLADDRLAILVIIVHGWLSVPAPTTPPLIPFRFALSLLSSVFYLSSLTHSLAHLPIYLSFRVPLDFITYPPTGRREHGQNPRPEAQLGE
jgi:hypothetical protein